MGSGPQLSLPSTPPPKSRRLSPAAPRTPCLQGGRGRPRPGVRRQPLQGQWQIRALPRRLGTAWEPHAAAREPGGAQAEASLCCQCWELISRWRPPLAPGAWRGCQAESRQCPVLWRLFGSHSRCLGRGRKAPWLLQGWEPGEQPGGNLSPTRGPSGMILATCLTSLCLGFLSCEMGSL